MCRIGGRLGSFHASGSGVNLEIPLFYDFFPNPFLTETMPGGQFDWGGRLLKGNGGVQRFLQDGLEIICRVHWHKGA